MFDAIDVPAVVLDAAGVVVETNEAWRLFAELDDGFAARLSVGSSYLQACDRAARDGDTDAARVAAGLREVLDGDRAVVELEYLSQSPTEERWVQLRAVAAPGDEGPGVVVLHRDITGRRLLNEAVATLADHDPGTGLLDRSAARRAVAERLAVVRRGGGRLVLAVIGVPRLDVVSGVLGPHAGDELVVRIVSRVRRAVRSDDVLFRTGPAQLMLLCSGLGENGLDALYQRLSGVLRQPYQVGANEVTVDIVMARAMSTPFSTADGLWAEAEQGFSAASAAIRRPAGSGSTLVIGPDVATEGSEPGTAVAVAVAREAPLLPAGHRPPPSTSEQREPRSEGDGATGRHLQVEALVSLAVAAGTVPLRFRPVLRPADQVLVGAEAVVSISDPGGGVVPEAEVVAAAARLGSSAQLGNLVLRAAAHEAAGWQRVVPELAMSVTVNLTHEQFGHPELAAMVRRALADAELDPSRLVLELSEQVLLEDPGRAHRQLARLKAEGVRLAIDEFGTGHTSLVHLKRVPLDLLKTDLRTLSSLAGDDGDAAIVTAIMGVASPLGLRVSIDGVASIDQLALLRRLGCTEAQGELWGGALRGEAFGALLLEGAPLPRIVPPGIEALVDPEPTVPEPTAVAAPSMAGAGEAFGHGVDELDVVFRAMVHEIRTPLTVAMGYASLLEGVDDSPHAGPARSIRRAAERINRMLANLEDVRMIDQGTLRLDLRSLDLRSLVLSVVDELREVVGIDLRLRSDGDAPIPVEVDELRIGQVLTNLISNAAKYCSAGTPVEVRLLEEDGWVELSVVDDGPGVPVDDVGLIFRKYGRADRTRPGSGLGLYLARGIARAHGGELTYRRRRLKHGSVFTLRLATALDA